MPTNSLSDAKCKAVRLADKATKLFDGGGLYLWVSPTGAKTWRAAYRFAGKEQTMSFGPYPSVSLANARVKREELKTQLLKGADPMAPRKANRATLRFNDAVLQYWTGRGDVRPRTGQMHYGVLKCIYFRH